MNTDHFTVEGMENGGIVLWMKDRDDPIAEGGCSCCGDNDVTLTDLMNAAKTHWDYKEKEAAE
ncbi:hypothetical protein OS965_36835 [Streptomyces sp. H27-G5]|uniref:hypothetical protein n=1 Tax=Streptomyces sp. H27-G5 TaxID=2996698 RepID=UPI00226E003C|nr:hypothetical protein [Streptomyces sp. H27-G5]MCY0923646.1 hypothetical protein [Streptomyces sp. H27-G5]